MRGVASWFFEAKHVCGHIRVTIVDAVRYDSSWSDLGACPKQHNTQYRDMGRSLLTISMMRVAPSSLWSWYADTIR